MALVAIGAYFVYEDYDARVENVRGSVEGVGNHFYPLRAWLTVSRVRFRTVDVDLVWLDKTRTSNWQGLALLSCQNYERALRQPGVDPVPIPDHPAGGCFVVGLARFGPHAS